MFHQRLVVYLDGRLELSLLRQGVALAGERAGHHLVVHAELAAALDGVVAALDARVKIALLEVHRRLVRDEGDVLVVQGDGLVVVRDGNVEILLLVCGVAELLLFLSLRLGTGGLGLGLGLGSPAGSGAP